MCDLLALTQQYASALNGYLTRPEEAPLRQAYELGREAIDNGLGILDIVSIHREALTTVAPEAAPGKAPVATRAWDFFAECLAPFEMTHRGFREANETLRARGVEIRNLDEELKRHVIELEVVNKELESFSYSVSHDLRAPLRAIDGFSRMLVEDHGDNLDAEARRMVNVIASSTREMGQLIDDLLAFSRLGRAPMKTSDINMKDLVEEVFEEMGIATPERVVRFEVYAMPFAKCDRSLMRQVFVNLLSNAVKFTAPKGENAVIEVGGRIEANENVYYVRDNGTGFDMKYADKMFRVFQRLHSPEEFAGTGIGLALVQRIVCRHGGRVWAEGKKDEGATFHFTLPNKETNNG